MPMQRVHRLALSSPPTGGHVSTSGAELPRLSAANRVPDSAGSPAVLESGPLPKRRRIRGGGTAPSRASRPTTARARRTVRRAAANAPDTFPIFGRIDDPVGSAEAEARQKIVGHLHGTLKAIRAPNGTDWHLVCPDKHGAGEHGSKRLGGLKPVTLSVPRLKRIHTYTEQWRFTGCELCFMATGIKNPDHDIENCDRGPECKPARRILRWLESLSIPHRYDDGWGCSTCSHGWFPCQEAARWRLPGKGHGRDGLCENKPVVRRMIAALCAADNQVLGKVLTRATLENYRTDLTCEEQAKSWFEGRMRVEANDVWTSTMICVLDQLLLAYNFHYSKQETPTLPSNQLWPLVEKGPWDPDVEVREWGMILDWLEGKCTFCAGRDYGEAYIGHSLRRCGRGGARHIRKGIGKRIYGDRHVPTNGCEYCRLPRDFCSRWAKHDGGPWTEIARGRCKYSENLLCEGIIGFYSCGLKEYVDDVDNGVKEDCVGRKDMDVSINARAGAVWLSMPLEVAGVEASGMMLQLSDWTKRLKAYKRWRNGGCNDC